MVTFTLNGTQRQVDGNPDMPLLWVLRDELGMTGTKFGCGVASCGACTVHVDGIATRSRQTFLGDLEGTEVTTIEGVETPVVQDRQQGRQIQTLGVLVVGDRDLYHRRRSGCRQCGRHK